MSDYYSILYPYNNIAFCFLLCATVLGSLDQDLSVFLFLFIINGWDLVMVRFGSMDRDQIGSYFTCHHTTHTPPHHTTPHHTHTCLWVLSDLPAPSLFGCCCQWTILITQVGKAGGTPIFSANWAGSVVNSDGQPSCVLQPASSRLAALPTIFLMLSCLSTGVAGGCNASRRCRNWRQYVVLHCRNFPWRLITWYKITRYTNICKQNLYYREVHEEIE